MGLLIGASAYAAQIGAKFSFEMHTAVYGNTKYSLSNKSTKVKTTASTYNYATGSTTSSQGYKVALTGTSYKAAGNAEGSGKTTLLNILAGLEPPTSGQVFYQDQCFYDLSEKKQAAIRGTKYGFIFQSFNLIPELTVIDNIRVPLMINNTILDEKFFNKLIKLLGLKNKLHYYPSELSGGEQQRTAIARAMMVKPQILFADEPTGNLDEQNSNKIIELIDDINSIFGTTIILVTHDLSLIKNPDKEFYINNGKINA